MQGFCSIHFTQFIEILVKLEYIVRDIKGFIISRFHCISRQSQHTNSQYRSPCISCSSSWEKSCFNSRVMQLCFEYHQEN